MPLNITLGTMSSRAFGMMDGRLHTVTFNVNGTWVCPAGVSNLTLVRGKGSDGVSDGTQLKPGARYYTCVSSAQANPPYAYWSDAYNYVTAMRNTCLSYVGNTIPANTLIFEGRWIAPDSSTALAQSIDENPGTKIVSVGPITPVGTTTTLPPTTGNVVYGDVSAQGGSWGFSFGVTFILTGNAGAGATAFGFTFPGGTYVSPTGNPATVSTHANVAVTPGNSYPITVPSGGFVSLSYYL